MSGRRCEAGFTLIELLVVMTIIALLLAIAVPRYFHTMERSKEAVLRQDLSVMREAIDKHLGDFGQYPDSLSALVERHYIRSIPVDPMTSSSDTWELVASEDQELPGIRDLHSGSDATASDGTVVREW